MENISFLPPISFENENSIPPEDGVWMRYSLKQNVPVGTTVGRKGERRFKRIGMIFFQVFIPIYSSSFNGAEICEKLLELFEGERLGEAWFFNGLYKPGIISGDSFMFNTSIEFRVDEVK